MKRSSHAVDVMAGTCLLTGSPCRHEQHVQLNEHEGSIVLDAVPCMQHAGWTTLARTERLSPLTAA